MNHHPSHQNPAYTVQFHQTTKENCLMLEQKKNERIVKNFQIKQGLNNFHSQQFPVYCYYVQSCLLCLGFLVISSLCSPSQKSGLPGVHEPLFSLL